jgi:hypothetical protein
MMRPLSLLLSLFLVLPILHAEIYRTDIRPEGMRGKRVGSIRILDQRELLYDGIKGEHFSEISDLAYLPGRHWLFMVSDEGKLYRFRARFGEEIRELEPLEAERIRRKSGKKLKKWRRDSEGLTLDGKGRLYVSFEGKPRIARLSYDGRIFGTLPLPRVLASAKHFRGRNKGLEALVWHPRFGLVTAPEYPLATASEMVQTLYALSGRRWSYRRGREPHSAITALEVLENGNFLILERAYSDPLSPMVVTLKELQIGHCGGSKLCPTRTLLRMDSSQGWQVENFEGLARVGKDRFLMISDDNDNFFQKTIVIYFEVDSR